MNLLNYMYIIKMVFLKIGGTNELSFIYNQRN